jgi:hypothetical protein
VTFSHLYEQAEIDDESSEQAYLQVDPRCYVRQTLNPSSIAHRKSDTPRLEKGHSLNVDTRSPSSSVSPYRQSSFDVTSAYQLPQQLPMKTLSPTLSPSTQQDIYYTPRGSSYSILAHPVLTPPTGSQHLSPASASTSRKNSIGVIHEKKELTATLVPSGMSSVTMFRSNAFVSLPCSTRLGQPATVRTSIVQREHEHSRSLEQSLPPVQPLPTTTNTTNDKQSLSSDAVNVLRPGSLRPDTAANRRTKSYENADDHRTARTSIAPPPIVIKIPDMTELVQAAEFSRLHKRQENNKMVMSNC